MSENELTKRQQALYPTMAGNKLTEQTEREMFREAIGVPTEIDVAAKIRSIAGRMMKHPDSEVRSMAVEILRHVERLETGR